MFLFFSSMNELKKNTLKFKDCYGVGFRYAFLGTSQVQNEVGI